MGPTQTPAPIAPAVVAPPEDDWRQRLPGTRHSRRRLALGVAATALVAASVVVLLARVGDLEAVGRRLEHADTGLVALAAGFEALSFAGYVVLTRIVFRPAAPRISWRASLEITLAGVVATRLVTAGGAGGIALTAWALRRAGLDGRTAAARLAGFLVVLYSVYFLALTLDGAALATGVLDRGVPTGLALAGVSIGGLVVGLALATLLMPHGASCAASRASWALRSTSATRASARIDSMPR